MEIDLTAYKKELDILAEKYLITFNDFLNGLNPNNHKPSIFLSMVWDENEKYISKIYSHVYDNFPQSSPSIINGIITPSQELLSHLAMVSYVAQIRKKFDNLQQKYLLAVLPDALPS